MNMEDFILALLVVVILFSAASLGNFGLQKDLERCNGDRYCELSRLKGI